MSNYFNEAGEPLMDGSAMRYEMYLDSMYEPEFDPYDSYEDDLAEREDYSDPMEWEDVPEDALMEYGLFGDC